MKPSSSRKEWFIACADGHGANGHFVSQFIATNMPKQFEQEKRSAERMAKSKDLVGHFKSNPNDSAYSSKSQTNRDTDSATTLFKQMNKVITATFLETQKKLEKQTQFDCKLSGSTLVTVYQKQNTFIFGNAGDSRAIIFGHTNDNGSEYLHGGERGGQKDNSLVIMAQTRDHKPDLPDEADRILNKYDG